jgi:hypothetical protein
MTGVRQSLQTAIALTAIGFSALCFTGCQYQVGSVMHPQVHSVAVGTISNATAEPTFTAILRGKLAEEFMRDGSLTVTDSKRADAIVDGEIVKCRTRKLARAKVRDERERADDKDAWQTVVYRAEVVVKYRVRVPGYKNPLLAESEVTGHADFSRFPDVSIPRQTAFRQALRDAALQITANVTEAW